MSTSIIADVVTSVMGQVPSQALGGLFDQYLKRRTQVAQEILVDELKQGIRLESDVDRDTFFGLLFRYLNATKQGVARRNLRLMAQIIQKGVGPDPIPFEPDVVASNAELVSSLNREEITVLAVLWRNHQTVISEGTTGEEAFTRADKAAREELIPRVFDTVLHYEAVAVALGRTGLVTTQSVWDGNRVQVAPRLEVLSRLCNLETPFED